MKIVLSLFLSLLGSYVLCVQAATLTFCTAIDENGNPTAPGNSFELASGGRVYFLIKDPNMLNTDTIIYKLYEISPFGVETYSTSLGQSVRPRNTWTWKSIKLNGSARYKVMAYNRKNELMASALLSCTVDGQDPLAKKFRFCKSVNQAGETVGEASEFVVKKEEQVLVYIWSETLIGCKSFEYKIYLLDSKGNEVFENIISQSVEPNWVYAWKGIKYYKSGSYKIYAYDDQGNLWGSSTLKVTVE